MMSIIPAIAALLSGVFMIFYSLSDEKVETIMKELDERRNKK